MNDLDARLVAALGGDAPPARDALFRLDVLARIARARLRRRILVASAIGIVATILVAVNARTIDTWIEGDPQHGWIVGLAALVALLAVPGMSTAATPGVRAVVKGFERWFSG